MQQSDQILNQGGYSLFELETQSDWDQLFDLLLAIFGILALGLILLMVAVGIFLAFKRKKSLIGKRHKKRMEPGYRLSRLMRSNNARYAAVAIAILVVAGFIFHGRQTQNSKKIPMGITKAEAANTPQVAGIGPDKQVLEEPLLKEGKKNTVKASFDAEATRLNLETGIRSWAKAWEEKRVNDYLGYYSPHFLPAGDEGREAWEANRRKRISKAQNISISIEEMEFLRIEPTQADVAFRQRYKSTSITEESRKTLSLIYADGAWQIVRENAQPYSK